MDYTTFCLIFNTILTVFLWYNAVFTINQKSWMWAVVFVVLAIVYTAGVICDVKKSRTANDDCESRETNTERAIYVQEK